MPSPSAISQPPMYEEVFGIQHPPFSLAPDPRFLYRSGSHDEAITALLQAIRRREGFIVLAGDIGTGKTTLCRALLQQLDSTVFTSLVVNPFLSVDELLREVLLDFGVVSREAARSGHLKETTRHDLVSALHEFMLSLATLDGSAVLIIDEAQLLAPDVLEQIRVLSNLETNENKLLQIVLVGQLNLLDLLGQPQIRQLNQRVSLRVHLDPLTREEVAAYVLHRLSVAGGGTHVRFEPEALDLIHTVSAGIPRVVNLLCDRALMRAAESRDAVITDGVVRDAAARLGLTVAGAASAPPPRRWRRRMTIAAGAAAFVALITIGVVVVVPLHRLVDAPLPASPGRPAWRPPLAEPISILPVPNVRIPLPPDL